MKIIKRINAFIALLLIAATFNSYSMKRQAPQWDVTIVGDIILGNASSTILSQPNESSGFTTLPLDMQYQIIQLLSTNTTTTSLKEAAKAINSLAQVNHQLNELINNPTFCLTLIKHLAKNFNCSDQEATEALQTQEAKQRLGRQKKFHEAVVNIDPTMVIAMIKAGIDIELVDFSSYDPYWHKGSTLRLFSRPPVKDLTALMYATQKNNSYMLAPNNKCPIIQLLLNHGADINKTNNKGMTALMTAAYEAQIEAAQCLLNNPAIMIDQQDINGTTALLYAIQKKNRHMVQLLLNKGADSKLANVAGLTPLAAAQKTGNPDIIDLIQDAIAKKHGSQ